MKSIATKALLLRAFLLTTSLTVGIMGTLADVGDQGPHADHPRQPSERPKQPKAQERSRVTPEQHSAEARDDHMASMSREASGTAWQPESTPVHAEHKTIGLWSVMQHYNAFLSYDRQSGPRGDSQFNLIGWYMLMGSRPVGAGELMLRAMLSPEPSTTSPRGYPLLFQTGESYSGRPLVDRQHPHDLFMEVAGRYRQPLNKNTDLSLYLAAAGEPALGPPAFPHRMSAMNNPAAPLGHHWQDSTHITFGVLTAGLSRKNLQLEGSIFTGREPDEHRWNWDRMKFDSHSGRLTYNPGANWSLQASYGYLNSPEALHPEDDVKRATMSALYNAPRRNGGNWASAFVWGRNKSHGEATDSFLLETDLSLDDRNTVFGRLERVDKPAEDLEIALERTFAITSVTIGAVRDLTPHGPSQMGVGASITFNWKPKELDSLYGKNPTGLWLFLRIRPRAMRHGAAQNHNHHQPPHN